MPRRNSVALQFRAESYDHPDGTVDAGTVMSWIDKAAYATAATWAGTNVEVSYVGHMHFAHPVPVETRVVVQARVVRTGRDSVHVQTRVTLPELAVSSTATLDRASHAAAGNTSVLPRLSSVGQKTPEADEPVVCTDCVVVYDSVDESGHRVPVRPWEPITEQQLKRERLARIGSTTRREVENLLTAAPYLQDSSAQSMTLRFLAATKDVYPGDTVQGGAVMRWIDEAANVCASRWCGLPVVSVFAGGVRFYTPVRIGDLVEVEARLVHTSARSMHVSVRARSGSRTERDPELVAHGLTVMVSTGEDGRAVPVPQWEPQSEEDRALERGAVELVDLRNRSDHEWAHG